MRIELLKTTPDRAGRYAVRFSDGSVQKLSEWCKEHGFSHTVVKEGEENGVVAAAKDIVIYSLKENYGFAKGNNTKVVLTLKTTWNQASCIPGSAIIDARTLQI